MADKERSNPRVGRRRFLATSGATVAFGLAGCTGGDGGDGGSDPTDAPTDTPTPKPTTTAQNELETLNFATAEAGSLSPIFKLIAEDGIAENHGFELEMSWMGPGDAISAMINQQVESSFIPPTTAARMNLKDKDIRAMRPLHIIHEAGVVPTDSDAEEIADLKGLKLGSLSRVSSLYTFFAVMAEMQGNDLDDFDFRIGGSSVLYGLMQKGDLDATLHFEPFVTRLISQDGFRELFHYNDVWKELTGNSILGSSIGAYQSKIDEKPKAFKGLSAAVDEAAQYIHDNPSEVFKRFQDNLGLEDSQLELAQERMVWLYPTEFDEGLQDGAKEMLQKMYELGQLDGEPPVDEMFLNPMDI